MRRLKKSMAFVIDKSYHIAGSLLIINMLMIVANIVSRRFFNSPVFGSTEFVMYCTLLSAGFAISATEWSNEHIKMTILVDFIRARSERAASLIDCIISFASAVGIGIAMVILFRLVLTKFAGGDVTGSYKIPQFILAGFLTFGFLLLFICLIVKGILSLESKTKSKDVEEPPSLNSERGV
jgi:TRAP-type C4-dicarboxylate transport system permease small subunit